MARPKKRTAAPAAPAVSPPPPPLPLPMAPIGVDGATLLMVATLQQQVVQLDTRLRAVEAELAARRAAPPPMPGAADTAGLAPLEAHRAKERASILAALEETRWNRKEVAERLGLPRRTLYRRMQEYGIQEGDTRAGAKKKG